MLNFTPATPCVQHEPLRTPSPYTPPGQQGQPKNSVSDSNQSYKNSVTDSNPSHMVEHNNESPEPLVPDSLKAVVVEIGSMRCSPLDPSPVDPSPMGPGQGYIAPNIEPSLFDDIEPVIYDIQSEIKSPTLSVIKSPTLSTVSNYMTPEGPSPKTSLSIEPDDSPVDKCTNVGPKFSPYIFKKVERV